MALIDPVPATKTQFGGGALSTDVLFSCNSGLVGISTDSAPGGSEDYHWLNAGDSIQIPSGLTVHYIGDGVNSVLHTMAMST